MLCRPSLAWREPLSKCASNSHVHDVLADEVDCRMDRLIFCILPCILLPHLVVGLASLTNEFVTIPFSPMHLVEPYFHLGPLLTPTNAQGVTSVVFVSKNFGSAFGNYTPPVERVCQYKILLIVDEAEFWYESANDIVSPHADDDQRLMEYGCVHYAGQNTFMLPSYGGETVVAVYPSTGESGPSSTIMTMAFDELYWIESTIDWSAVPSAWLSQITATNFMVTSCYSTGYLLFGANATMVFDPTTAAWLTLYQTLPAIAITREQSGWVAGFVPSTTQLLFEPFLATSFPGFLDTTFCATVKDEPTLFVYNSYSQSFFFLNPETGWHENVYSILPQNAFLSFAVVQSPINLAPTFLSSNVSGYAGVTITEFTAKGELLRINTTTLPTTWSTLFFAFQNLNTGLTYAINGLGGVSCWPNGYLRPPSELEIALQPTSTAYLVVSTVPYVAVNNSLIGLLMLDSLNTTFSISLYKADATTLNFSPVFIPSFQVYFEGNPPDVLTCSISLSPALILSLFNVNSSMLSCMYVAGFLGVGFNFVFCPSLRQICVIADTFDFPTTNDISLVGALDQVVMTYFGEGVASIEVVIGELNVNGMNWQIHQCFQYNNIRPLLPPDTMGFFPLVVNEILYLLPLQLHGKSLCPLVFIGYSVNTLTNCSTSYSFSILDEYICKYVYPFGDAFVPFPTAGNVALITIAFQAQPDENITSIDQEHPNALVFTDIAQQKLQALPISFSAAFDYSGGQYFFQNGLFVFLSVPYLFVVPFSFVGSLLLCPAGYQGAINGAPSAALCEACPVGSYAVLVNASECIPCPYPSSTQRTGSTSSFDCNVCPNSYCHSHGSCVTTLDGAVCQCDFGYYASDRCELPWFFMGIVGGALIVLVIISSWFGYIRLKRHWQSKQAKLVSELDDFKRSWIIDWSALHHMQKLSAGAFGTVYRAVWGERVVAVKVLHVIDDTAESLLEFERECRTLRQYRHPQIVLFFGSGINPSLQKYVVTEFVEFGCLLDVMKNEEHCAHLHWPARLTMAVDIALGVDFLHRQNPPVIHRDLKSPNILVTSTYRCKIADLGTARLLHRDQGVLKTGSDKKFQIPWVQKRAVREKELTQLLTPDVLSTGVGTVQWSAPEILSANSEYNLPVDIYACAIVFWELACNAVPYHNTEWDYQIKDYVRAGGRPGWPEEHFAKASPGYVKLVEDCWSQKAEDRPVAEAVLERLTLMS